MAELIITLEAHDSRDAAPLLGELDAYLLSLYPAEAIAGVDSSKGAKTPFYFFLARLNGEPIGCGGWRSLEDGVGELKRLYVRPDCRGDGVARQLVQSIETHAASRGVARMMLESGVHQHEANAFYERCGYTRIPNFGEHVGNAYSVCFARDLADLGLGRFTRRVEAYRQARPGYPDGVYQLLTKSLKNIADPLIADIGSGTGIFTGGILRAGLRVVAVEPDDAMRAVSIEDHGASKDFCAIKGTGEETGLPSHSVDAITAAQSFHWCDAVACREEFRRILRPSGLVMLVWNEYDLDSPFVQEYDRLLIEFGGRDLAGERRARSREKVVQLFEETGCELFAFPHVQRLDRAGLHNRAESTSHTPLPGETSYAMFHRALDALFDRFAVGEEVVFPYAAKVFLGDL